MNEIRILNEKKIVETNCLPDWCPPNGCHPDVEPCSPDFGWCPPDGECQPDCSPSNPCPIDSNEKYNNCFI